MPNEIPMRGLLLYPEFPDSAFWSYRHVMRMVGAKSAFPPLGLMTFAAAMPAHWSFELLDLNVEHPSGAELRERFAAVDAVFVSAMSVQKRSLVALLSGPARSVDTPWVLGGPYPSSYRDHILNPATESDEVLHRGLDVLVWGECDQWIDAIDALLHGERSDLRDYSQSATKADRADFKEGKEEAPECRGLGYAFNFAASITHARSHLACAVAYPAGPLVDLSHHLGDKTNTTRGSDLYVRKSAADLRGDKRIGKG